MRIWNLLAGNRLGRKKCFKFVSSCFKFELEVAVTQVVAISREQIVLEMAEKAGKTTVRTDA